MSLKNETEVCWCIMFFFPFVCLLPSNLDLKIYIGYFTLPEKERKEERKTEMIVSSLDYTHI